MSTVLSPKVETHGGLRFERTESVKTGASLVKAWRGKAKKPYAYYIFRSLEQRETWIESEKQREDAHAEAQTQRKIENEKRLAEQLQAMQPGTILHYAWGYEQTQCEYYIVVARKGKCTAIIQEIGAEPVPGSDGFMCDRRKPNPSVKIGEPFEKRITPWGIRMDYGAATICGPDAVNYCSWYA